MTELSARRQLRASAVFPLLAMGNHSCLPTVFRPKERLDMVRTVLQMRTAIKRNGPDHLGLPPMALATSDCR